MGTDSLWYCRCGWNGKAYELVGSCQCPLCGSRLEPWGGPYSRHLHKEGE